MPCGAPENNDPKRPPEILIENLHKGFHGREVLRGVDLTILQKDIVAIVGGSGAGKTVLMNHMVGLLQPDMGRVLIADHGREGAPMVDLARASEKEFNRIRLHWSLVFQQNALLSGMVFQNLALWLKENTELTSDEIYQRARESLDAVGFAGDDSIMTKRRSELSGGMAKRVAVARAISMKPSIIFYDEPTTGLDPQSAANIHDLICSTRSAAIQAGHSQTTVIITHDKDLLYRLTPRIVMLAEGKVFFDGHYSEFEQSDSEIIRPYFKLMPLLNQAPMP